MKKIFFIICITLTFTYAKAQTGFENVQAIAKANHKLILLNFSGSDWCIPCIKMHKEIFENEIFKQTADSFVIIVHADFPRNKKNQPNAETRKLNDALAEKYNSEGAFPYTLLLDANGKILKVWNGLPSGNAADFSNEIKMVYNSYYK